ncbi:MAG: TlpA family protein disulfide reductase [Armatimonadota bacterium]|jgi:thiol-disulfide isomerase/thioredoxin
MRVHAVLTICIVALLACSIALAQETCDFVAVGGSMDSAAAQGDWDAAFAHARQIVVAAPADLTTLSADEQYWIGLAHRYLMAQAMEMAKDGLEDDARAALAAELSASVLAPQYEDVRTISHGEEVTLEDYLVAGQNVIIDFTSKYCPPCVAIAPRLEALAQQRDDIVLVKVDINRPDVQGIDWQSPVARQYDLRGIPYFMVYGPDGELQASGNEARAIVVGWLEEMEG